jgi:protoporphyrinogen oxidase
MRIAVIGGGIVGVSLAYFLSRAGHRVVLYEASDQPGGLAGTIRLGDVEVDRFYHTILSSDTHMQALAAELGIADRLRFRPTGSAFFHEGRLSPMTTLRDFMAFPLLRTADRIRLGPRGLPSPGLAPSGGDQRGGVAGPLGRPAGVSPSLAADAARQVRRAL